MQLRNIKITIEYDGTNYCGWQKQIKEVTIQQKIEEAIKLITGETVDVIGSSRTDSGVHAREFVANFYIGDRVPLHKIRGALNSKLPEDIVVLTAEEVDEKFHARYCSKGKTYSYTILNRYMPSAIERNTVYHVKYELNVQRMREACKYFIGTHDFAAFKSPGSSVKTSVRTITELRIEEQEGNHIKIFISADGFLYNMVRIIVGTLILVGSGKLNPEQIQQIIESKDRTKSGKCVPASGLCLEKVFY